MQLRFATGGAAEGWAEVVTAVHPFAVATEQSVLHDMAHGLGTLARYVVVEAGEVLGVTRVREEGPGRASVLVQVRPDQQGRGVGRMLLDKVLGVAGDRELSALVHGEDRSLAVARHWGFEPGREHRVSAVTPADAALPPPSPEGLRVAPLTEVAPAQVWACHQATAHHDPSGLSRPLPLEEFVQTRWTAPLHRPDLGRAVLEDVTVVAFTEVEAAGVRAWNAMTGTLPSHRGRGLAALVKAHALAAMADAGITRCGTGNDRANRPMLAVNDRLGYRVAGSVWSFSRAAAR